MFQQTAQSRWPFLLFSALFLIVPTNVNAFQDAEKKADEKPAADDPFKVPAGDAKELLVFAEKIAKMRPRVRTIQELRAHLTKANGAVEKAVEMILADKSADDATVTAAVAARFSLLSLSSRYDRTAVKAIEESGNEQSSGCRRGSRKAEFADSDSWCCQAADCKEEETHRRCRSMDRQ